VYYGWQTLDEAFNRLNTILNERCIRGCNNKIRGGFNCVCFTEAPIENLKSGLINPEYFTRYAPFGIMVPKQWLFSQGGRPVVYESESEYDLLSDSHKWRHVRYEPNNEPPIDFTWEREWRIKTDSLSLDPTMAMVVVEDKAWAGKLIVTHRMEIEDKMFTYAQLLHIFKEDIARLMFDHPYQWNIITIR
jgi:hypothetical protein